MEEKTVMLGFQCYVAHTLLPRIKEREREMPTQQFEGALPLSVLTRIQRWKRPRGTGHFQTERPKWEGWRPAKFWECEHVVCVVAAVIVPDMHRSLTNGSEMDVSCTLTPNVGWSGTHATPDHGQQGIEHFHLPVSGPAKNSRLPSPSLVSCSHPHSGLAFCRASFVFPS